MQATFWKTNISGKGRFGQWTFWATDIVVSGDTLRSGPFEKSFFIYSAYNYFSSIFLVAKTLGLSVGKSVSIVNAKWLLDTDFILI